MKYIFRSCSTEQDWKRTNNLKYRNSQYFLPKTCTRNIRVILLSKQGFGYDQQLKFCLFTKYDRWNTPRRSSISYQLGCHFLHIDLLIHNHMDFVIVRYELCKGENEDRDRDSYSPICHSLQEVRSIAYGRSTWIFCIVRSNTFDVFRVLNCSCTPPLFFYLLIPFARCYLSTFQLRYPTEQAGSVVFRNDIDEHDAFA